LKSVLPDLDLSTLAEGSVESFSKLASKEQLPTILSAYNDSLRGIWYLSLGLALLILFASLGMEWKNVKTQERGVTEQKDSQEVEAESPFRMREKGRVALDV
jgi:hypothetical protein